LTTLTLLLQTMMHFLMTLTNKRHDQTLLSQTGVAVKN